MNKIKLLGRILFIFLCYGSLYSQGFKEPKESNGIVQENVFLAEYPGGNGLLGEFISDHIKYPRKAYRKGIEGKVVVEFTVDKEGYISEYKIVQDIGYGCGEEVIRVLKLNQEKWKPARADGILVRSFYRLPVIFNLDKKK